MSFQEHDVEKASPAPQPFTSSVEPSTRSVPAPTGAVYTTDSRPLSINQPSYLATPQRPPYMSLNSAMTLNHIDVLRKYQEHLGIHNNEDLTANRAAANLGIFPRVIANEKKAHQQFQLFTWLINGALGLQIIFAAALTALGAGNGPRSAVTAFGAMNTIIAGFLTFLKGSGLPNRLKFYENEWSKVREYMEQRERDFAHVTSFDHDLNLLEEIAIIEHMYESVRKDIEANTPDSYISTSKLSGNGTAPGPSLARGLSVYGHKAQDRMLQFQSEAKDRYSYIQHGTDSRLRDAQSMASGGLQEIRTTADNSIRQTREALDAEKAKVQSQVHASVREVQADAEAQIRSIQEAADARVREMQDSIKQSEQKAKEVENKVLSTTEKAAEKVLSFIHHRKEG